ncbi:hypothetical protein FA13DRAFT_1670397, partial [Coprinellus micaceus]
MITYNPDYFRQARNFRIGTLNQFANGNTDWKAEFDRLVENVAADAIHGAQARSSAPECYPATRVAVREDITKWIRQEDSPTPEKILWVSGPAGAGKTAIAGSLAEAWKGEKLLAASFFFSSFFGSSHCRSTERFIATLVYQLIRHRSLSDLKTAVLSAIRNNPLVFQQNLKEQLETLILDPLRRVDRRSSEKWPKAILIDGVDECEAGGAGRPLPNQRAAAHKEILSALTHAATHESFPFLIIVVSRPDPTIDRFF